MCFRKISFVDTYVCAIIGAPEGRCAWLCRGEVPNAGTVMQGVHGHVIVLASDTSQGRACDVVRWTCFREESVDGRYSK